MEFETAALLDEIRLGSYEQYRWEESLDGINPHNGQREKVEQFLMEFYKVCCRIALYSATKLANHRYRNTQLSNSVQPSDLTTPITNRSLPIDR